MSDYNQATGDARPVWPNRLSDLEAARVEAMEAAGEVTGLALTHRWSEPCGDLFAALAKAQAEIKGAAKDSTNPHFKSRYADLASVKEACGEALSKHGIAVIQMPINGAGTNVGIATVFAHSSGQFVESRIFVAPGRFDAQSVGSVLTYLRRYSLAAMAGVAPEDDDGEAAIGGPRRKHVPAARGAGMDRTTYSSPQATASADADHAEDGGLAEVRKRVQELGAAIRGATTEQEVDEVMTSLAFQSWDKLGMEHAPSSHPAVKARLEGVAADRKAAIQQGQMEPFA